MCADYNPARVTSLERLSWDGKHVISTPKLDFGEAFPGRVAPFLAGGFDEWLPGMFGLVPHWGDPIKLPRSTYNARSETVGEKPSYRSAWKNRQLALIPAESFFEPSYESGKPVRWRIERADREPFCIAGIWEQRRSDSGPAHWSFSMLTINADDHQFMRRFHKPGDEKRSVVILDPADYQAWLEARDESEIRSYLRPFDPDLMIASPDPMPPRKKATA